MRFTKIGRVFHLCNEPHENQWRIGRVGQHASRCVEQAEVCRAVNDDALHGHYEPSVQSDRSIRL